MGAARGSRWLVDARPRLRLAQPALVDLHAEAAYWRACCRRGLFDTGTLAYADYARAFRLGAEAYLRLPYVDAADIEPVLRAWWRHLYGDATLPWSEARRACLAAWSDLALGHWSDEARAAHAPLPASVAPDTRPTRTS